MAKKIFLITDYDGTFTNTHDLCSDASALSADSAHLINFIKQHKPKGVFGCTHRGMDGFSGFEILSTYGVAAPAKELSKQKVKAIDERLRQICMENHINFYGTSTEYDNQGVFAGLPLLAEAEDSSNANINLHKDKKITQQEKNGQLKQLIQFIVDLQEFASEDEIEIHFYDDKLPILDAITEEALELLPNMVFYAHHYKHSTLAGHQQEDTIVKELRGSSPIATSIIQRLKIDMDNPEHLQFWQQQVQFGGQQIAGHRVPHTVYNLMRLIEPLKNQGEAVLTKAIKQQLQQPSDSWASFFHLSCMFRSTLLQSLIDCEDLSSWQAQSHALVQ